MILAAQQPEYFPWLPFFEKLYRADVYVSCDDCGYRRGYYGHRRKVFSPSRPVGWRWLGVPVRVDENDRYMDVKLGNDFVEKQVSILEKSYSSHPFYSEVMEELWENVFLPVTSSLYLLDLNLAAIRYMAKKLGIDTPIFLESEVQPNKPEGYEENILMLCRDLGADVYYCGINAKVAYGLDVNYIVEHGVEVVFQENTHVPYRQHDRDWFLPGLSAIDALMNLGSDARDLLVWD